MSFYEYAMMKTAEEEGGDQSLARFGKRVAAGSALGAAGSLGTLAGVAVWDDLNKKSQWAKMLMDNGILKDTTVHTPGKGFGKVRNYLKGRYQFMSPLILRGLGTGALVGGLGGTAYHLIDYLINRKRKTNTEV